MIKGRLSRASSLKVTPTLGPITLPSQMGTSKADRQAYEAYAERCRKVYGCEPAPIGIYLRVNPQYAFYAIFD